MIEAKRMLELIKQHNSIYLLEGEGYRFEAVKISLTNNLARYYVDNETLLIVKGDCSIEYLLNNLYESTSELSNALEYKMKTTGY